MVCSIFRRSLLGTSLALVLACSSGSGPAPVQSRDAGSAKPSSPGATKPAAKPPATGMESPSEGEPTKDPNDLGPPPYQMSNRSLLQWKRQAAFEADLMAALKLSREELCVEVGGKNCVRDVHLVPLGGNDPYESGLMKPNPEPLATTSSVVDRVLLSACSTRARLDAEKAPEVFKALDFKKPLPAAGDAALTSAITDLYRRLLTRDPTPREVELVSGLATPEADSTLSTQEFAALACFTIGSSAEFLFF